GLHEGPQLRLHRFATLSVPGPHERGDLVERAAQLLGPGDERQPPERGVVVDPVAGPRALDGRDQAEVLVVAQRRRPEAGTRRRLGDRVGTHADTVRLRAGSKVKPPVVPTGGRPGARVDGRQAWPSTSWSRRAMPFRSFSVSDGADSSSAV